MGLIGSVLSGLLDVLDVSVDLLLSLPVPVLGVLILVILFLIFGSSGSSSSSSEKKLDTGVASEGGGDLSDPTVSFCRSLGAPDHPHEEGCFIPATEFAIGNASSSTPFRNEFADGEFIALHRATYDQELNKSGDYPHGKYFLGKKRLWEARVQFRFKKPPRVDELYFGIELEGYVPMNRATKRTMETLVVMLKRVVGNQIYHSPGDNPEVVTSGELENPVFVMPLWAFDQFIVTPEGEAAPNLAEPLSSLGSSRYKRVRQFKEELEKLEFRVGPTYTFCFWGISQWLDKLRWVIKMPLMSPLDFNLFCGAPPVHVVIYSLKKGGRDREKRHLPSIKQYYFDCAFWSSRCRPPLERIQELLRSGKDDSPKSPGTNGNNGTFVRQLTKRGGGNSWFQCCSGR